MRFMKMNKKMIKHLISLFGFRIIRIDPTTERNSDKLSSEIKDKDYFRLQEEFLRILCTRFTLDVVPVS